MSSIIKYLWQNRLIKGKLQTTDGKNVEILDYGTADSDKEWIIRNGKARIGDRECCGSIILHTDSTTDEECCAEDAILHIYVNSNSTYEGMEPLLSIRCHQEVEKEFAAAEQRKENLPCHTILSKLSSIHLHNYFSRMLAERLEEKAEQIEERLRQSDEKWDETLLKTLIRSFGFGIHGKTFEELAKLLDLQAIGKHRDNPTQIEAMLFGQAGLLNDEAIPYYYRDSAQKSQYYRELQREYKFLENKFGLKRLHNNSWSNTTPHTRIARIAAIICRGRFTMSQIAECNTIKEYYEILDEPVSEYWHTHNCFGGTETYGNTNMRQRQMDVLIINSIIPLLYVYGRHRRDEKLRSKAEDFMYNIKGEENSVTRRWKENGVRIDCAADSQALLQITRRLCQTHNCLNCLFASLYIRERIAEYNTL